ncbi:MAG: HAD family hydrolase [Muribaculaceae bacterium]|nr:HAD family hydrolase [Muribaculaceae bacterium]
MKRVIVGFDLDDTLVAEVLFIRSGIRYIARLLHSRLPGISEERITWRMEAAAMRRQNHYSALESLLSESGLTDTVNMRAIVSEFRSHLPDPEIYHAAPSILDMLETLRGNPEIETVLITDGRSSTQRNKIQSAGLYAFFDSDNIYISEETGYDKTSPDTFLRVMEKYAGADEFHYVGDNPAKDFLHPSRLGWHTHRVHPFPLMIHQGMPRYRCI